MTRTRTAIIIGGGIAGPTAALALHRAGIDATVYEAHTTGADGVGAFLTLAANGIDALRVIDADEGALAAGFATPTITLRSCSGKRRGEARTGGTLADGTVSHTLKRGDLYRALHRAAAARDIRVELGRRLVAAESNGVGVRARFADGREARADMLIGCDGINSTVRRIVDPRAPQPTYAGLLNTGGYARGVQVNSTPGGYEMIFGKRAFFGYAAAPTGQVWWFANLPHRQEPTSEELAEAAGERLRHRLLELFANDAGPATALIEATPELTRTHPIHTVSHLPLWQQERMIVLGDAAHAPSPSSGQGASLAIEDAVLLAKCLQQAAATEEAFARLEALRRPRVKRIIKWAARVNSSKAAGPVGRAIRDAVMPTVLRLTADNKAQRQIHDYRIDWDPGAPDTTH